MTISVRWIDGGLDPQEQPDPRYPDGFDVDLSNGASQTCSVALIPYPAPRIGYFAVICDGCGRKVALTTAGRLDDPRSVKLACKGH